MKIVWTDAPADPELVFDAEAEAQAAAAAAAMDAGGDD